MAVVKSLPGVKVTLSSNGRKLKEYKSNTRPPGDNTQNKVFRFIEASTDAEFLIKIHVSGTYQLDSPNLLFDMYVDGMSVGGVLCGELELIHGNWTKKVEGVKQSTAKRNVVGLRKFRFSELTIENGTRDAKLDEDRKSALRIGEVQIQVHRCSSFLDLPRGRVDINSDLPAISRQALEERVTSHGTTHSPTKRMLENVALHGATYVDGEDNPIAVLNFSYRSKGMTDVPVFWRKSYFDKLIMAKLRKKLREGSAKRTEQTEDDEEVAYLSHGNELFAAASDPARKVRKIGENAEIELTDLAHDSEDD